MQRFAYDTELQLPAVTMNGASWRYRYDEPGHLVGETDFNDHSFPIGSAAPTSC
ncbi:RHS repeat protein [Streptomyces sp. NBC_01456]|uniref:RHS repeat domain-containing protein n=1 Tax=unclassified Streptomyces TaxID=2593676 RepID=UPI002E366EFD|nr:MULTISPECIES: RHS repeat domain-containing protein [unclassified Streptomyces]